jgi:hypothetical protein
MSLTGVCWSCPCRHKKARHRPGTQKRNVEVLIAAVAFRGGGGIALTTETPPIEKRPPGDDLAAQVKHTLSASFVRATRSLHPTPLPLGLFRAVA